MNIKEEKIKVNKSLFMIEILERKKEMSALQLGISERNLNDESKKRVAIMIL